MIFSLLEGEGGSASNWIMLVVLAVLIVAIILFYVFGSKKRRKQEQDAQDLINAVKPGNKVKTIGGICGIVVEVDNEENTFVLETGTEQSGKSYLKFDRQAIYQTDAVVEKKDPNVTVTDAPAAESNTEAAAEAPVAAETTETVETSTATQPVEETPAEEKPEAEASKPEMVKKSKGKGAKKTEGEKQVKF